MNEAIGREGTVRASAGSDEARRDLIVLLRNLVGVCCILAVLGLAAQQFLVPPNDGDQRRSSWSASADGFRGLYEVADRLGYPVARHEVSFGQLPSPPAEHSLLVIDPLSMMMLARQKTALDTAQLRALREWVRAGGNLVVALPGRRAVLAFGAEVDASEIDEASDGDLVPRLLEGVAPLTSWTPMAGALRGFGPLAGLEAEQVELAGDDAFLVGNYLRRGGERGRLLRFIEDREQPLELLTFAEVPEGFEAILSLDGAPLVVHRGEGQGRVWLVSSSYPFTNMGLSPRGGSAPWVQRLVHGATDGGRRALVFDEFTHGLWERKGLFSLVWASPLRFLVYSFCLLVVVIGWRGSVRLGPTAPDRSVPRRAKEEFVISLADLAQRAGRFRAAARWLYDARKADLPLAGADPGADELARVARGAGPFGPHDLEAFAARLDEIARQHAARRTTVRPSAPPEEA